MPWAVAGLLGCVAVSTLVNLGVGRFRLDGGVIVLLGLAGYTALQAAGLPQGWVAALDPITGETWSQTLGLLHSSAPAALSLEPDTTRYEAARLLCYGLTWGVVSARAKENGPLVIARWISWLVVGVAALTVLHRLLGVQKVYGFYAPHFAATRWVGPLLNPNNLGGLCNLGVFAALACSSRRGGEGRPSYFVVAAALGCLTVLTASRGAVLSLIAGGLVYLGGWLQRRGYLVKSERWSLAYALIALLTLVALTLDASAIADLSGGSIEKFTLLRWGAEVLRQHPYVGVGMGAFGAEVGGVSGASANVVFPYVECLPLDVLSGWGLGVGAIALGAMGWGLWRIGGGFRTQTLRLGLGVVLVQNFMDLGLQVPGLALPWFFLFAACWGGGTRRTWAAKSPRWGQAIALVAITLGAVVVFPLATPVGLLRTTVATLAKGPRVDARREVDRHLLRFPGDAYLLRTRAGLTAAEGGSDALAWVNVALRRAPSDARTHFLLGQMLLARGKVDQGLLSLRLAATDRALHGDIVGLVGKFAPARVVEAAPDGPIGAAFLRLVAGNERGRARIDLLEAAVKRAPAEHEPLVELTSARLEALAVEGKACAAKSPCHAELDALVQKATTLGAPARSLLVLRAQLQAASGDSRGAFDQLWARCERSPQGRKCLLVLVAIGQQLGKPEYEQAVEAFLDSVCGGDSQCSSERMRMADQLSRQGSTAAAHRLYVRECAVTGLPEAYLQAARTAFDLGRAREAFHWLDKGKQKHAADPAVITRLTAMVTELGGKVRVDPER